MTGPCHLVAHAGDNRSLCGIKDPAPVCTTKAAPTHRYNQARCTTCYTTAGLASMLTVEQGAGSRGGSQGRTRTRSRGGCSEKGAGPVDKSHPCRTRPTNVNRIGE